jgi:hypothetical protein
MNKFPPKLGLATKVLTPMAVPKLGSATKILTQIAAPKLGNSPQRLSFHQPDLLGHSDLKYIYSWTAAPEDNPKFRGGSDSAELNRHQGYEILFFINRFSDQNDFKNKESGLKVERMIQKHLPSYIRSHANVTKWLVDHWDIYD